MYPAFQLLQPPYAPYKINPLIRFRILYAKHRSQQPILQNGYIQPLFRMFFFLFFLRHFFYPQTVPAIFQIHSKAALFFRSVRPLIRFFYQKAFRNTPYQFPFFQSVQVFYHPVIVHDHQLVVRKQNRKKVIEFFLSRIPGARLPALEGNFYRRGASVMPVRNINAAYFLKCFPDPLYRSGFLYFPYPVNNTVGSRKIIERPILTRSLHLFLYHRMGTVRQKNRPRLRLADIHMAYPINFLIFPCIFMFPDHRMQVIIHGRAGRYPCL